MKKTRSVIWSGVVLGCLILGGSVLAGDDDAAGYGEDTLTFERWCGEIQGYDPARCAKRSAEDVAAFEAARDKLAKFEIDKVKDARREEEFRKTFEAHDSVDRNRRFDF